MTSFPSVRVVIIYAHLDQDDRKELVAHLSALIKAGIVEIWDDYRISAGSDWRAEILASLEQADIVLPLISHWFLASLECQKELDLALEFHRAGKTRVMPILLGEVLVDPTLGSLQFLSEGPLPEAGESRNAAFTHIATKLQKIAAQMQKATSKDGKQDVGTGNQSRKVEDLNAIALHLAEQGIPGEALKLLDQAIETCRHYPGERSEDFAALISNRGLVLQDLGDLEGARQDLESAWEISEDLLGPSHPIVARRLTHLGGVLVELGDEEGARPLLERALATLEVIGGALNPDLFLTLVHLGGALISEPRRARELLERTLTEDSQEPRALAAAYSALGQLAFREGRFQEARVLFHQASTIGERVYKGAHPFVGMDLHNLGLTHWALGQFDKARGVLQRALTILRPRLGAESPRVRRTEESLALEQLLGLSRAVARR